MELSKRSLEIDSDEELNENELKRRKLKESKERNILEEKVRTIINNEFKKDLDYRQSQLELIQQRINLVRKSIHILRYALVTSYYNKQSCIVNQTEDASQNSEDSVFDAQSRIHPAVKKLLGRNSVYDFINVSSRRRKQKQAKDFVIQESDDTTLKHTEVESVSNEKCDIKEQKTIKREVTEESNNGNYVDIRNRKMIKHRIIVGNISKWMPSETREDSSTHKWMVYVRGSKENPEISHFVQKVVFYLHPSYKPNDVIELKRAPFHLSRRGWGEFPLRVQIFFHCSLNKPVDVIHNLKLDRTYTGRQTLGNETVADLYLYDDSQNIKQEINSDGVKAEIFAEEHEDNLVEIPFVSNSFEHDYCTSSGIKIEDKDIEIEIKDEPETTFLLDHNYCLRERSENNFTISSDASNDDLIHGLSECELDNPETIEEVICDFKTDFTIKNGVLDVGGNLEEFLAANKIQIIRIQPQQSLLKKNEARDSFDSKKYEIAISRSKFKNVAEILPYLLKRLPLFTHLAREPNYKIVYPYAVPSEGEYLAWNIGKQRSCEWRRAKTILNLIKSAKISGFSEWNTRSIIMYARSHGYTPSGSYEMISRNPELKKLILEYKPNSLMKTNYALPEPNVHVNILDSDSPEKNGKSGNATDFELDQSLDEELSFVRRTALHKRIHLKSEELLPGCHFRGAERMIWESVKLLANDLIRNSRAELVTHAETEDESSQIGVEDVLRALERRSEFQNIYSSLQASSQMQYYW